MFNLKEIIEKINIFNCLEYNWDCYGAVPLSFLVKDKSIDVISNMDDSMIQLIENIFPSTYSTLCIDFNTGKYILCLEIGKEELGYFMVNPKDDDFLCRDNLKIISNQDILNTIKQIKEDLEI